jgi:hypothetical protein
MTDRNDDKQFTQKAKAVLDQQANSLNSDTLQRLRHARETALSQKSSISWLSAKWLTGAGAGLALASILTFLLVPQLTSNSSLSPLEDIDLLSAEADMDLYTQLDFYQWLDESLDES